MNYYDILLAKKLEDDRDPRVEGLSVTENGRYEEDGVVYKPVIVSVAPPEDSYQLKSITTPTSLATFEASNMPMPKLKVSVEAKQDLHGYDKPWVGGGGKNKLPLVLSDIKALNTSGTWNGDDYTVSGITFAVNTDSDGNITSIKATGTPTSIAILYFVYGAFSTSQNMILNGCPSGGGESTYQIDVTGGSTYYQDSGSGVSIPSGLENKTVRIRISSDNGSLGNGVTFYPMIRLATEQDATFAPYSNECPISGWSEVNVSDVGKNLYDSSTRIDGYFIQDYGTIQANADSCYSDLISVIEGQSYTFSGYTTLGGTKRMHCYDEDGNWISRIGVAQAQANSDYTITAVIPNNAHYIRISLLKADTDVQVEEGSTATAYEPYNGTTTTISLPQTVYGAEVDVVNGVLKITDGYIASYNGETLPSTWISSMDEYAEGTTPTTGAEVCYELANPIIINLTPTLIKSLDGTNNLSVDSGEVIEGEYFKAL